MTSSYDILLAKPRNRFTNILNVFTRICNNNITGQHRHKPRRQPRTHKGFSLRRMNSVSSINMPVVDRPNPFGFKG